MNQIEVLHDCSIADREDVNVPQVKVEKGIHAADAYPQWAVLKALKVGIAKRVGDEWDGTFASPDDSGGVDSGAGDGAGDGQDDQGTGADPDGAEAGAMGSDNVSEKAKKVAENKAKKAGENK